MEHNSENSQSGRQKGRRKHIEKILCWFSRVVDSKSRYHEMGMGDSNNGSVIEDRNKNRGQSLPESSMATALG